MPFASRKHIYNGIPSAKPPAAATSTASSLAPLPNSPVRAQISRRPDERDPFSPGRDIIELDESNASDEYRPAQSHADSDDEDVEVDEPDEDGIRRGNKRVSPLRPLPRPTSAINSGSTSSQEMSPHNFRPQGRRAELQVEWDKKTSRARAAKIVICGSHASDRESVPNLPPRFVYLEDDYVYSASAIDIDPKHLIEEDFTVCHHGGDCKNPPEGDCCIRRKRNMDASQAYDERGRWRFKMDKHIKVVECNRFCECDKNLCPHSVSQRPRKHILELFDTGKYGWGVRTPKDLPRGTVLGVFTGELISRAVAEDREAENLDESYIFDLDHEEGEDDMSESTPRYSVDARTCGNWSRFINHSCSPNVETYTVQFDAPHPLVFVTSQPVEASCELTIDYYPQYDRRYPTRPAGRKTCRCGSKDCRGWR
ncbi:SET domain-containing protein [Calocera cornea HHB12733]|uniref:SET domain-containing protein n=1 Tax=Calocera cornea HHB12733 TaxID=1353952 RepID=A0A165DJ51_9BASI|nr:SET domain-containing protein [Calocera cornea HHB12733]